MSIAASIRSQLVPIHPEGYLFIGIFAVVTIILFWLWPPFGWIGIALTIWCTLFFRDPVRVTPLRDGLLIAPADGRISQVALVPPPAELGMGDTPLPRISIFMSVFDCHINRSPISGQIERVAYRAGVFLNADLDKASEDNERNSFLITAPGFSIAVVQIAGLVARRIVSFTSQGQTVEAGQRLGMIRFGSRVDVYLPAGGSFLVAQGQRTVAGETVIADLRPGPDGRNFRAD